MKVRIKHEPINVGDIFTSKQGCKYSVIEKVSPGKFKIKFSDCNGYEKLSDAKEIRLGAIKNPYHPVVSGVGYMGVGIYEGTIPAPGTKKGVKNSKAYEVWRGIMRRCYDIKHQEEKVPAYRGCSVNPIWHNFQNFAHWYYNNPFRQDDWHLDKDIISRDNKEYGPLRCAFVPNDINVATTTTKANRGLYPIGVYFKKDVGKFRAQLGTYGNNQKMLVESHDPMVCFMAYKEAKENYMKELADLWEGKVDKFVINGLRNWIVRETD